MDVDLPPHAFCMQSLKYKPFVDPEELHLPKKDSHPSNELPN